MPTIIFIVGVFGWYLLRRYTIGKHWLPAFFLALLLPATTQAQELSIDTNFLWHVMFSHSATGSHENVLLIGYNGIYSGAIDETDYAGTDTAVTKRFRVNVYPTQDGTLTANYFVGSTAVMSTVSPWVYSSYWGVYTNANDPGAGEFLTYWINGVFNVNRVTAGTVTVSIPYNDPPTPMDAPSTGGLFTLSGSSETYPGGNLSVPGGSAFGNAYPGSLGVFDASAATFTHSLQYANGTTTINASFANIYDDMQMLGQQISGNTYWNLLRTYKPFGSVGNPTTTDYASYILEAFNLDEGPTDDMLAPINWFRHMWVLWFAGPVAVTAPYIFIRYAVTGMIFLRIAPRFWSTFCWGMGWDTTNIFDFMPRATPAEDDIDFSMPVERHPQRTRTL